MLRVGRSAWICGHSAFFLPAVLTLQSIHPFDQVQVPQDLRFVQRPVPVGRLPGLRRREAAVSHGADELSQ